MFRWIITLIVLAALVTVAGYLARETGSVVIEWRGYYIHTSFGIAVLCATLAIAAVAAVLRVWWFLLRTPRSLSRGYESRQQRRGYEAVSRGMVAVAAGDPETARRQARKSVSLLGNKPLSMLLSAQSAQLDGDEQAAKQFFETMQGQWDTEFLGVRGLLMQAIKGQDWGEALSLAKRAYSLNPKSPWVVETLYDLQKRTQQWSDAKATLEEARRLKLLPEAQLKSEMASILYQKSLTANPDYAIQEAKDAYKADPAFIPAAVRFATLLAEAGLKKKAARIVEDEWAEYPHPDLAAVYWSTKEWSDAKGKLDVAKRLARINPKHEESRLIIAECAIAAKMWDEAHSSLQPLADENASPRVCRLMAALEEGANGDRQRAREWLMRASGALDLPAAIVDPDPVTSLDAGDSVAPAQNDDSAGAGADPATSTAAEIPLADPKVETAPAETPDARGEDKSGDGQEKPKTAEKAA